jgi:hypothetical protein
LPLNASVVAADKSVTSPNRAFRAFAFMTSCG